MDLEQMLAEIDRKGWRVFQLGNTGSVWIIDTIEKKPPADRNARYLPARGASAREACENWLSAFSKGRGDATSFSERLALAKLETAIEANLTARRGYAVIEQDFL